MRTFLPNTNNDLHKGDNVLNRMITRRTLHILSCYLISRRLSSSFCTVRQLHRHSHRYCQHQHQHLQASSDRLQMSVNTDSILYQWAAHETADYHHFTPDEAKAIRKALLTWYQSHRRKLPWRGDPPPYDGSTAAESIKATKTVKGQTKLKSFFTPTAVVSSSSSSSATPDLHPSTTVTIPLSGYSVWVSEIMLQQTRVEAVIPFYLKWMSRFPTVQDLAAASEDDVNAHWAGLGFYRRAKLLHKGSQTVVSDWNGTVPTTVQELLTIPGIGPYTAHAIASIAFDRPVAVVDGNVCRVLSRLKAIANHIKAPVLKDQHGWILAQQLMDAGVGNCGEVNQALMELGATYCAPSKTGIEKGDPLKSFYRSTKLGAAFGSERVRLAKQGFERLPVEEYTSLVGRKRTCPLCDANGISIVLDDWNDRYNSADAPPTIMDCAAFGHGSIPIVPPKTSKRQEVLAVLSVSCGDSWLLVQRPKSGLLASQWEFPSVCVWTSDASKSKRTAGDKRKVEEIDIPDIDEDTRREVLDTVMAKLRIVAKRTALQATQEHVFSHVRHTMWIESCEVKNGSKVGTTWEGRAVRWMNADDMVKVGLTSGVRKVLKAVQDHRAGISRKRKTQ